MSKLIVGVALAVLAALLPNQGLAANTVVEYVNTVDFGTETRFFITADPVEQASVDSGAVGSWERTGGVFKSGGDTAVCRFYGSVNPGPNSHFYTADQSECAGLKVIQLKTAPSVPRWNFESLDFATTPAVNGSCAAGLIPVYRAYNNGYARGVDSNHRITTVKKSIAEVVAKGWADEGAVMCAPSPCDAPAVWNGGWCMVPEGTVVTNPKAVPTGCTDAKMSCWSEAVTGGTVTFIATSARTVGVAGYEDRPVMFAYFINGGGNKLDSGPYSATLFWADTGEPIWSISVSHGFGVPVTWAQGTLYGLLFQQADGSCHAWRWFPPTNQPGVNSSVWSVDPAPCP